jgi:hypothetical protein
MHAVTRLGRVIQQLRSFGDLHASELEALAAELEDAAAPLLAARLRALRDVQRDEGQIVVDELADIQRDAETTAAAAPLSDAHDPAINSPRRARWLAEQAAEAERLKQPFSRRDLFSRGAPTTDVGQDQD